MKKSTFLKTLFLILIIASTVNGQFVSTFAGSGAAGGANNTVGALATFFNPGGICNDNNGNLYVVDHKNHKIRKIVVATGAVSTFAGGNGSGSADNAN